MSDVSGATESSLPPIQEISVGGDGSLTAREAASALSQHRYKRDAQEERDQTPAVQPAPESSQEEIPATAEATGEQAEAVEQPEALLELPRSWSKDKAELWAGLDPSIQNYLLDQDSKATKAVRQAQNEAAEQRRSIDTERQQMEQARKQYEEALPVLLQTLQQQQMGEFSDIKTIQDVERLAREDWPRYALWDAQQKKVAAIQQEMSQAQQRQQQEFRVKWEKFAGDEDAKFLELAPEMVNAESAKKVADASLSMLKDIGFTDQDLSKLWNGEASLSLRDHRAQLLIRDAVRYRQAQANAPKKASKPVPVVQRPGSPASRVPEADIRIKQIDQRFESNPTWKNAAELLIAQRAARR